MSDKPEQSPESEIEPEVGDLRFAPPAENEVDVPESLAAEAANESGEAPADAAAFAPAADLEAPPEVDLDAALAAISALDDMLAEQEAAEQAEQARQQAAELALVERQQRLKNPELFFPMPSITTMQRGRLDSVIPALVMIGVGAWLTFSLTTGEGSLSPVLLVLALGGGLGVTLLARWLASGRWALGTLFFALVVLLTGGIFAFLLTQGTLAGNWPLLLIAPGLAYFITGAIAGESKLLLPGLLLAFAGLAGLVVTNNLLPAAALATLAGLWPLALVIILVLLLLPRVARPRE